jgi:acetyl-CoA C-acetyltransferase
MVAISDLPGTTPVVIAVGQSVERTPSDASAVEMAARAASAAIEDSGVELANSIDTICVVKTFSDTVPSWAGPFGRSNNPPQSVATRIGANPERRIYTQTGGNEPQGRVIEFARRIAEGECEMVLLCGAESIKNQKNAVRRELQMDWKEEFEDELEDRGFGEHVATQQERKSGLNNVLYYYGLIEQAQADAKGRSIDEHKEAAAQLFESFSAVASTNPFAQFEGRQSAADILSADPLSHLYTKRMIAQDGVNQGAAVILCSIDKARDLGIPESQWVFMHGMAEGKDWEVSKRPDPATSPVAGLVAKHALDMAGVDVADINLIDIYSCFPCAVVAVAEQLGLATDGSRQLTLTGGLPYFGGPGNNYSMHGIAQAIIETRKVPEQHALVTTNGGVLSKHASAVYSCQPSAVNWATAETYIDREALPSLEIAADPGQGNIVSFSVHYGKGGTAHAVILGQTTNGERFVAMTADDDTSTAVTLLTEPAKGRAIEIDPPQDEKLIFRLAS